LHKNDIPLETACIRVELFYPCLELCRGVVEQLPEVPAEMRLVGIAGLVGQGSKLDVGVLLDKVFCVIEAQDAGEEFRRQADILEEMTFEFAGIDVELLRKVNDLLYAVPGLELGCNDLKACPIRVGLWFAIDEVIGEDLEFLFAGWIAEKSLFQLSGA
jgi:hypothetical protein